MLVHTVLDTKQAPKTRSCYYYWLLNAPVQLTQGKQRPNALQSASATWPKEASELIVAFGTAELKKLREGRQKQSKQKQVAPR